MSALLHDKTSTRIISDEHERVGLWMQAREAAFYRPGSTCIGLERNGQLVAATLYDYYNRASIFANIAIDGPITRDWLHIIFDYPFRQLDCRVILGLVARNNWKSQRLTEHFGFKLAASIPDADPSGAMLMYVLRKEDCRWLRRKHV